MLLLVAEIIEKFCSSQTEALHGPSKLKKSSDRKLANIVEFFTEGLNFSELARFQDSFLRGRDAQT